VENVFRHGEIGGGRAFLYTGFAVVETLLSIGGAALKLMKRADGFSRVDLLAVLAMISLLALTFGGDELGPGEAAACQNHMRQLARAQFLYASDHDYFPPNVGSGDNNNVNRTWMPGVIASFSSDTTNVNLVANSMLSPYVERNWRVFKCPSDKFSYNPRVYLPRVRSVSMNHAVGTDPADVDGPCKRPVPGILLNNSGANQPFRCFARPSDIVNPTPANLFIFLDEHADSINDSMFASSGPGPVGSLRWIDIPAAYHDGSGSFGMADGRAELHRWNRPFAVIGRFPDPVVNSGNLPDLQWLASKTTALRSAQP
jgi:hypothetical protein